MTCRESGERNREFIVCARINLAVGSRGVNDFLRRDRVEMSLDVSERRRIERDEFVILAEIERCLEILRARSFSPANDDGVGVRRRLSKLEFIIVNRVGGNLVVSFCEERKVVKFERIAVDGRTALRARRYDVDLTEIGGRAAVEISSLVIRLVGVKFKNAVARHTLDCRERVNVRRATSRLIV